MERLTRKSDTSDMVWFIDREHEIGYAEREPCDMDTHHARLAIAKLAEYEDLEERLQKIYGECDGLFEKVVDHLERHNGVDFTSPAAKARLLTDEDVDRWAEYKTLDEQGKLLKLPCKLGDITYWISGQDEDGNKIPSIRKNNPVIGIAVQEDGFYILCDGDDEYQKVGERWSLLTREDAEATLKEL